MEELDLICPELPELREDAPWKYRDYQVKALKAIEAGWAQYKRQLLVLATGLGKTVVFAGEALATVKSEVKIGQKVLILAHSDELLVQAADKLKRSTGLDSDLEKAEHHASMFAPVVVASIQSISKPARLALFSKDHFSLIICDECHLSLSPSWLRVINYFDARVLGVTATPDKVGKRDLGEFYQHCAFEYNLRDGCRDGWLVRPIVKQMPVPIDLNGVKISRSSEGADLDLAEVSHRIEPFIELLCKILVKECGNRKTVVFVPSIRIAKMAAECCTRMGYSAGFVSGECPDRVKKIKDFRAGTPQIMFNAMLLVLGFDDEAISCVSLWRPTKIRRLMVQAYGRGTRPLAGLVDGIDTAEARRRAIASSSKPDLLILDPLWLSDRLSLVKPVDLVAHKPGQREEMLKNANPDLLQSADEADVDLLKSLAREAAKHAHRKERMIDPLAFDTGLQDYEPTEGWEHLPPEDAQIKSLTNMGFNTDKITTRGNATKLIDWAMNRKKQGLCSPKMMKFLEGKGYVNVANITAARAQALFMQHTQRRYA
jgi:superfamily II DNA or RNA helicase